MNKKENVERRMGDLDSALHLQILHLSLLIALLCYDGLL